MAKRLNLAHDDETRRKIQTSQLINRLNEHIFGKARIEATQLKAIEILLKKSLPDLSSVQMTGDVNHSITKVVHTIVDPKHKHSEDI